MVIEQVHGLHATGVSLNERFSILASSGPNRFTMRQKRRPMNSNMNFKNRNIIEQIARRLEQQARRQAIKQRLGMGTFGELRRFGSENSLPNLRRSNSFGSLNQERSIKERIGWRQSNGNLSRSASFGSLSLATWGGRGVRGMRARGGQRPLRGRYRGGRITRVSQRMYNRGPRVQGQNRNNNRGARGGNRGAARGNRGARGRGRGATANPTKPVMTKEQLDEQLEQYMAGSKAALDRELDIYMKNAMDLE